MIKKIFGLTEQGEQVELEFKRFLMVTDNDSHLVVDTAVKHPESPDLLLNIDSGPTVDGHRFLNILPGAANMVFVKVVKK